MSKIVHLNLLHGPMIVLELIYHKKQILVIWAILWPIQVDQLLVFASFVYTYLLTLEWEIIHVHVKKNIVKYSCCKYESVQFPKRYRFNSIGPETFPDLTYTIQMRRRPLFYVFNMILPCFMITIVAFLGFCVPSDSGKWNLLETLMRINQAFVFFSRNFRRKSFYRRYNSSFNDSFSYARCRKYATKFGFIAINRYDIDFQS